MSFLFVHSKIFSSLPASAKPSIGHISKRKPVVPCGRIVVSSLHCGCSKPGLNPGQVSILLSGSGNMTAFCHLNLQLDFVFKALWSHVLPSCSQDRWLAADRSSRAKSW